MKKLYQVVEEVEVEGEGEDGEGEGEEEGSGGEERRVDKDGGEGGISGPRGEGIGNR